MNKNWRVILDGSGDGYSNMAKDEAIFNLYPYKKIPTLRIYGWQKPFVSLGYFQWPESTFLKDILDTRSIPFVRRLTGGAAILHGSDLTYSLTLSTEDLELAGGVKESFRVLTSFLMDFYRSLGAKAQFAQDFYAKNAQLGNYGVFCFSTCEHFDILISGKKIGGNAQKRKGSLIFQQGSLPLVVDYGKIRHLLRDIPGDIEQKTHGINQALGKRFSMRRLRDQLYRSFEKTFEVRCLRADIDREEKKLMFELLKNKYRLKAWNSERNEEIALAGQEN